MRFCGNTFCILRVGQNSKICFISPKILTKSQQYCIQNSRLNLSIPKRLYGLPPGMLENPFLEARQSSRATLLKGLGSKQNATNQKSIGSL